jgi:hypothetical protein
LFWLGIAIVDGMRSHDTSRDASDAQREAHRRLGPAGRVALAFAMSHQAREISISGMRHRDPSLSYSAARALLLARLTGIEDLGGTVANAPK